MYYKPVAVLPDTRQAEGIPAPVVRKWSAVAVGSDRLRVPALALISATDCSSMKICWVCRAVPSRASPGTGGDYSGGTIAGHAQAQLAIGHGAISLSEPAAILAAGGHWATGLCSFSTRPHRRGWRVGQVCLSATRDLTVSHVDPAVCCHRFQHPAIMSDQEQRAGIGLKGGLQLLDRRQVKMVRRLVKH
jgi:hypothetical protein